MKIHAIAIVICAALLAGCSTIPATSDSTMIQRALNHLLPADFTGDAGGEFRGQYVTIQVTATGLRRLESGLWTWRSLSYDRASSIPIFSGVPWKSTGKVWMRPPE